MNIHSTHIRNACFRGNFLFFSLLVLSFLFFLAFCKEKENAPDNPSETSLPLEQTFAPLLSAGAEKDRLFNRMHHSDFWFNGFYAHTNNTLKVETTHAPSLLIGTYSRYKATGDPQVVKLKAGKNAVAVKFGGLIYVRPETSASVNVKFVSGQKNAPYFKLGKTTEADWIKQLDALAEAPDVLLEGKLVMMVMSRQRAIEYKDEDHAAILNAADSILSWEAEIAGLDGSKPEHRRSPLRFLMTETDGTSPYMYATSYRTAYSPDGCPFAFTKKIMSEGWGPWHEIGHQHQQNWTWNEVIEVTVNIFSLQAERKFGLTSRLKREKVWAKNMDPYLAKPVRNYNTDPNLGAFGRLCLFQQLRLAFGDSFFKKLHQKAREEKPPLPNDAARMRYFMLTACKVSEKNLTVFFQRWGMPVPQSVYDEIAALNLPSPAAEPSALRE